MVSFLLQCFLDVSKEVGLEVKTEKTKYMLLPRHQNGGKNHDIKIGNRCFEIVAQFRYLGTTITDRNLIQEEIKRRLNSRNACCHSVQNLLSSRLLSQEYKKREVGWDGMDWIDLAQDRDQWSALVNTVMNLRVP
ncbi:hypothetical protein B7P43_G11786 [Cryptotermes secundus]|uniref:Reverse transcriptase domain-containing protein n=1 Tax=Cryptotermes secundus TaxID=105785 RepID=A0A2J7PBZ0_9NEOP|nr:hypothetical protein B7P43_G11786 [Cryptotermes secundus]